MSKWKRGEYVEDSTKGKAIMKPKKFKGDALIQAWLDRRKIAGITQYLDSKGVQLRFMSDVMRNIVDIFYETLAAQGVVKEMSVEQAGDYLQYKFRVDLNPQDRGRRNLLHNKILEEQILEHTLKYRTPATISTVGTCEVRPEDLAAAERAKAQVAKIKEMTQVQENVEVKEQTEVKPKFPPEYYDENGKLDYNKAMAIFRSRAQANAAKVIVPRKPQIDIEREERRKLREQEKELGRVERLREKLAEAESKAGIRPPANDDRPRPKTDEEIEADYKRIENKDKALLDALNAPAPSPPVD